MGPIVSTLFEQEKLEGDFRYVQFANRGLQAKESQVSSVFIIQEVSPQFRGSVCRLWPSDFSSSTK